MPEGPATRWTADRLAPAPFEIRFPDDDNVILPGQVHRYPRVQDLTQKATAFAWQWRDGAPNEPVERATFDYLETHQFEYRRVLPNSFVIRHPGLAPRSVRLLTGLRTVEGVPHGDGFRFDELRNLWLDGVTAQHATLILTMRATQRATAAENSGRLAVALWLRPADHETGTEIDWLEQGQPPSWQTREQDGALYLVYAGALARTVADRTGEITLRLDGDSQHPISTQYAAFRVVNEAQNELARAFAQSPETTTGDFEITYVGTANARTRMHLGVTGCGRIDGQQIADRPDYTAHGFNRLIPGETTTMFASRGNDDHGNSATTRDLAEYQIDSGLISLASGATGGFAVTLSGITIANAPTRHQAAVNVNVVTMPMASLEELVSHRADPGANNRPVSVRDVKVVGNWRHAADGPEIGGDGSVVEQVYLHIADDAIKISAKNVAYRHATVIQGDIGGVINLGSYGFNRGVEGSRLDGIYVHRVTQKRWHTRQGTVVQDDNRGGLITTRTGNFNFLGQGSNGLTEVHITGLYVPSLLIDGEQINAVARVSAIGVMGGHQTTRTVFVAHQRPLDSFDFGPIVVGDLLIEPEPRTESMFYIDPFARDNEGRVVPADPAIVNIRTHALQ
jgi:hypothetical protein